MPPVDLTPEPPSNVIAINAEAQSALEINLKEMERDKSCPGRHIQVTLDPEHRLLKCNHCGFTVDPFDYVLQWAREGSRRMAGLKSIETKRKIAQAEHDDLMRKVKNMRAQLKRGGFPQPYVEKNDYDQQRWRA